MRRARAARAWTRLASVALLAAIAHATTDSQPSLPPETAGLSCGVPDTQVTICFPGNRYYAECEYAVTNSSSSIANAQPCPTSTLYDQACSVLDGLLVIAYGPCQSTIAFQSAAVSFGGGPTPAPAPAPSADGPDSPLYKSIPDWLQTLGLQGMTQIGGLLVRGYAYQLGPLPSTYGIDLLPALKKVGALSPVTLDNARLSPLTILGAAVPQLDYVTDLEGGMLLENTPNLNFSGVFGSLQTIKGTIRIVGNTQLTSLDGLQGLSVPDVLSSLEILSNPRLSDISALETVFACTSDGRSGVNPRHSPVGVIEVRPSAPKSNMARCLLTTAEEVCSFIENPACPPGTDSIASGAIPNATTALSG